MIGGIFILVCLYSGVAVALVLMTLDLWEKLVRRLRATRRRREYRRERGW